MSKGWCPYKKRRGYVRCTWREVHVQTEADIGLMCHMPRNAWDHCGLEETRKDSPLEPTEGAQTC